MCSAGQTSRKIDVPQTSRNDPPIASLNPDIGNESSEKALCGPACLLSASERRKDIPHNDRRVPDMCGCFRSISLIPGPDARRGTGRAGGGGFGNYRKRRGNSGEACRVCWLSLFGRWRQVRPRLPPPPTKHLMSLIKTCFEAGFELRPQCPRVTGSRNRRVVGRDGFGAAAGRCFGPLSLCGQIVVRLGRCDRRPVATRSRHFTRSGCECRM